MVGNNNNNTEVFLNQDKVKGYFSEYLFKKSLIKEAQEPLIYNGWIVDGGVNFIVGRGGLGKTFFTFSNVIKLSSEYPDYLFVYIDIDNPPSLPKSRGWDEVILDRDNIFYINSLFIDEFNDSVNASIKGKLNKISKYVEYIARTIKAKAFIIFDSLQNFVDINEQSDINIMFDTMHKYKDRFTYILIHHENKLSQFKGLQLLHDRADSFFYIKNVDNLPDGRIKSHIIYTDKQRFSVAKEITFNYDDIYISNISVGIAIEKEEAIILRTAISLISKSDKELSLTNLVNLIKDKININEKKIKRVLNLYKEKGLFFEKKGLYNAKYLYVKEDSPYLDVLFPNRQELTQSQKELIELVYKLKTYDIEIDNLEFNQDGKNIMFNNLDSILNAVRKSRIDDDLAKLIIEKLVEFVAENG